MYLRGNKWSYTKRKKRSNPWSIIILVLAIGAALYFEQVIVPATPPLFIPTSTPTSSPESFVAKAESLLAQGKMSQAIQAYEDAVQSDPKNPSTYVALARLQVYTNKYPDALTNIENALLLNPNNSTALALRGWVEGFLGNWVEAETSLNNAISQDPNNAVAYAYLAEVLADESQAGAGSLGTLDNAIEMSKKAVSLAPNSLETHRARGIVLEITANYQEAVKEFEAAVVLNPNIADLHMALGRNYRFLQQYDKAIDQFNRANALNPSDPLPDTYISRTYATVGEYAKAIQFAQQAVKESPQDPLMQGNLGEMYYRNKQYQDALVPLRLSVRGGTLDDGQEVKGLPLDYGRVAEYYYTYGLALAHTSNCGEALQLSQLIQQGVPKDDVAVFNAQEMIKICQQVANTTVTPTASLTGESKGVKTPAPGAKATPAPTATP
jgi:tetratricopeptide (TPR) repeat protein